MRKLVVFDTVSLDGYFVDASGDMSWAHKDDPEWNGFVADNASAGGTLLFGRVTYELMASFWPTPQAMAMAPIVAKRMNSLPKIVFSRTLESATWSNTKIVKDGMLACAFRPIVNAQIGAS
jgi:dihydrofolate reductase